MSSSVRVSIELVATGDQEVQSKLKAVGKAAKELAEIFDESSTSATKVFETFLGAAEGANKMTKAAFGLWTKFDDLEKVQLKVASATLNVESSQTTLMEKQQALNELVQKGVTVGTEYEIATRQVKQAEDELAIAQKKEEMAQGSLTEAYVNFALSVVPALKNGYDGFTKIKEAATSTTGKYILSIIQETFGLSTNTGAKTANIGATVAATGATHGLSLATRVLHFAMGPIGLVIMGIGAALTLFATNAFGVRDAINAAGKAIGDAFPIMKPLLDGLAYIASTLFPDTSKESNTMSGQVNKDFASMQNTAAQSATGQAGSLTDMGGAYAGAKDSASQSMRDMERAVSGSTHSMIDDLDDLKDALGDVGISGGSITKGIASSIAKSVISSPATTTVPNPLGGTITVQSPTFGTIPIAELRQNPVSQTTTRLGPVPANFGTREINIHTTVEVDKQVLGNTYNRLFAEQFA